MIQIGEAIVSFDLFEKQFVCNINKCKGMCCVYGEAGAPLAENEIAILQDIYPKVKPYMTQAGIEVIEKDGVYVTDFIGEKVTPLVGREDCAYACSDGGVVHCAIEKACRDGKIDFLKPISCHLYPVRITKYPDFEAVNYHHWTICSGALRLGKKTGTPLYVFLKEPLTRKYGAGWYEELCIAAQHLKSMNNNKN